MADGAFQALLKWLRTPGNIRSLIRIVFVLLLLGVLFLSGTIAYGAYQWQFQRDDVLSRLAGYKNQIDRIRNPIPFSDEPASVQPGVVAIPTRVYDANGRVIGEFYTERRSLVPLETLPGYIRKALIASEDRGFEQHSGVSFSGIIRAFIRNLLSFRFSQGGSTITQQLAKVLFTNQEKTFERKVFEYFCAREIEERYTKTQIIEMYLNLVYMGHSNYGIESAARYYFNKRASSLSIAETAMIIGLLPNPTNYSPVKDISRSLIRQRIVLTAMTEEGFITANVAEKEIKRFKASYEVQDVNGNTESRIGKFSDATYRTNLAPFFLDYIRSELNEHFDNETLTRGGLNVYTTLDYRRQVAARDSLISGINRQKTYFQQLSQALRKKGKVTQAEELLAARENTNGAFISMDPRSGYILAMIGGAEFSAKNQFNRATKAYRQIGSLMKPFVYYLALAQKIITPATLLEDTPLKIGGTSYQNADRKYLGKITARDALRFSRNVPAVRLLRQIGVDDLRSLMADLLDTSQSAIAKRVPNEAGVALGTPSFSPLEVTRAYAAIVNRGVRVAPRGLLRVEDSEGKVLWTAEESPAEVEVVDPIASYILISMLQGTLEPGGTAGWIGSRSAVNTTFMPFEAAGKTGTTSDYRDAWFAGFTSDEVNVIWIGNDQNVSLGDNRGGGAVCAPAWADYISIRRSDPPAPFRQGWDLSGTVSESYCAASGGVPRFANSCKDLIRDQVFYPGTEPRFFDPAGATDPDESLLDTGN